MPVASILLLRTRLLAAASALVLLVAATQGVLAQDKKDKKDKMLVEANELVYDKDNDTVTARGNAQIYYQGRSLEADKVTYNRKTKRVFAEGNARMTDTNGTRYYGDRFELTDDFKDGFIDSLRSEAPDKQRFAAIRGERTDGKTSVFDRGTYTACEPCKDDPAKPPLWQVRAARIIHKSEEQTIYYEQATLEFWGVPIAYMPFFSGPDPSVSRKSGFMAPIIVSKKSLGQGVSIPYFWAIAPNMDLTLTPTFLSRQGVLGQAEFRHRLNNGMYSIRAAGIFQRDPSAFLPNPLGGGSSTFRGSIETVGRFHINERWRWGWSLAASTDKFFYNNYRIRTTTLSNTYLKESISTLFLNGQGDRSWFDLRGYYFRPLSQTEWQKQQALVHPVFDYDKRFSNPFFGGEFQLTANLTSLSREAANFSGLPGPGTVGNYVSPALFSGIAFGKAGQAYGYSYGEGCVQYIPGSCLLRGVGGDYTRASLAVSWRRTLIDPIGQVWTPFASLRGDLGFMGLNNSKYVYAPNDLNVYGNDKQRFFLSDNTNIAARMMPMVGVEYRYPFVARHAGFTHQVEPIAQLIVRPNETRIGRFPNEDAHSLVFDDTLLFARDKFSGFDRVEGGVRANVGVQYTLTSDSGAYANMLFGQSYHLSGRNSFAQTDMINTGLNSGLESRQSDFVSRITVAPGSAFNVTARGRFDEKTFALKRMEVGATATLGAVSVNAGYARLAPQPLLGYNLRREGMILGVAVQLPSSWYVSSGVSFDMDRYLSDRSYHLSNPTLYPTYRNTPFRVASLSLGLGYRDECTDFSLTYSRSRSDTVLDGTVKTGSVFLFRLELKHLGQAQYRLSSGLADTSGQADGLGR
ncbi:MAG TPA: LPS-assembly protein LptD [Beijerinckiaceae bacterium]|nr:LPS-assembly protein LptD [Beijerinckiaceae bacterium]